MVDSATGSELQALKAPSHPKEVAPRRSVTLLTVAVVFVYSTDYLQPYMTETLDLTTEALLALGDARMDVPRDALLPHSNTVAR